MPFPSPITTKRMKTDPALDCRFCRKPGGFMICGSALMEVAMSAAKCAATQFQMQASINADAPLPFPMPDKRVRLMGAYDSSETRVYLSVYQYARLAKKMGVTGTSVRRWLTDERMRQGHHMEYTKYPTDIAKKKGKPPAVEVRTQLPLRRGRRPRTPQASWSSRAAWSPKEGGEYEEEESQQDEKTSVTWTEGLKQLTMYAYNPETHEVPVNPQGVEAPKGCLILSDAGVD